MSLRVLAILVTVFGLTAKASANTDINGLFDARSAAMGGSGVAYLDSPGAIPINPALLDQIGKLSVSVNLFYINTQTQAPFTVYHLDQAGQPYRNYETVRGDPTSGALPFFGVAYRLVDRVVIGAAAYPVIGQGGDAKYRPAPDQYPAVEAVNHGAMGLVEAGVPVAVRVLDNLSVALMWRVMYMTQSISTPMSTGEPPAGVQMLPMGGQVVNSDVDVSGVNFGGLQAGVLYRPMPSLRLGLTYRSKVVVNGSGSTTALLGPMPMKIDTRTSFTSPHTLRAGLAWSALHDRLLIAADFKYLMYAEAYKTQDVTLTLNGMATTVSQPLNWKDAYVALLGTEYRFVEGWRARIGYALSTSATPADHALALGAPPGIGHSFGGGLGVELSENFKLDVAASYVLLVTHVDTATEHNAGVGTYAARALNLAAQVIYRM